MKCEFCYVQGIALCGVTLGGDATTLFRCPSCGCCQVDPPFPGEMVTAHYRDSYFSGEQWQIRKSEVLAEDYLAQI